MKLRYPALAITATLAAMILPLPAIASEADDPSVAAISISIARQVCPARDVPDRLVVGAAIAYAKANDMTPSEAAERIGFLGALGAKAISAKEKAEMCQAMKAYRLSFL